MKFSQNKKQDKNKSKLGEIRMISDSSSNQKNIALNPRFKNSTKSKVTSTSKIQNKLNTDSSSLETSFRPAININFKEILKDISKEIPNSLKCNLCKNLVKSPTKCYQCKALFCKECLFNVLNKNKKCPKCFKIILIVPFTVLLGFICVIKESIESFKQTSIMNSSYCFSQLINKYFLYLLYIYGQL